jgi:hypothetical protein
MSQQRKCLRCGHEWTPRAKRIFFQGGIGGRHVEHIERESKRCARCRSPYWNKMYVRQNENRAPGSVGYQPPLPLLLTDAGRMKLETFSDYRKRISPPKRTVAGTGKKVQTSQRRRAAAPLAKLKHGKTKQGKQ